MSNISLFIGSIAPLPGNGRPSGIYKQPVNAPLHLGSEGFAGDQQADRSVHGGPEKAVHLYPASHYARLARAFPEIAGLLEPGSLGENISSSSLDESQVRIGDVFGLGSARIQVCQPRNPCWKIDVRFGEAGIAAFISEHRLTGWYFRVIEPGNVSPDAALELVAPATGAPSLAQAMDLWHSHRPTPQSLRALAALPGIASNWQRKIVERATWLESNPDKPAPRPTAFHVKPEGH
ncbi:MAG: MOSC domain-containing protein [Azonexus sp.]